MRRTGAAATDSVVREGRVDIDQQQPARAEGQVGGLGGLGGVLMDAPFAMPYDSMLPKRREVSNLLVPVALSATHVRFNAVRMEPTWMILGHAAGAAAALAAKPPGALHVHDVDVAELRQLLVTQKQLVSPE